MTDIIHLPLNRLTLWDGNVRKTDVHAGIDELAASISSHGLLQSLVVCKGKRGKFGVVAGQRRLLALQSLAEAGAINQDHSVPCLLADASMSGTELSLAENAVRAPMHPADQFEAFRDLVDQGLSVADVAARFGIHESIVTKRLKLGRLSPVILDAYRRGELDLDDAQAFAISDDQEAQERLFEHLPEWNRKARTIRELLTKDEIPTTDKRVKFIGLDFYRAAGGAIRQDLFDDDNQGFVIDVDLLEKLVAEKLAMTADTVSAEGWNWVEIEPNASYDSYARYKRAFPDRSPLSEAQQIEFDRLGEEYDALVDSDDADEDRLSEIERRRDELEDACETWSAITLSSAGAIVSICYNGDVNIERGLVRKADAEKLHGDGDDSTDNRSTRPDLPSGLIEDLTTRHGAALGAGLISRPDIALIAIAHSLALDAFYQGHSADSCLRLTASKSRISSNDQPGKADILIEAEFNRLYQTLPENSDDLWGTLLVRSQDELLALLALISALTIDATQRKSERSDASRLIHARELGQALSLDMGEWFKPTAVNYFARIGKQKILEAVDEATGSHAPALEKLKKSELAIRAEGLIADTNWLPKPLRSAVNDNSAQPAAKAAE